MKYIILLIISLSFQYVYSETKIHTIAENDNYLFVNIDTLPIVDINISFNQGSINDGKYPGITNLMLNNMMASNLDNKKVVSYFENIGAQLSYSVNKESLSITIRSLSNHNQIINLMKILNQAIWNNNLDENILKLEKEKIIRKLSESKKLPGAILETSISERLFKNTGLSHQVLGKKESIKIITDKMLLKHRDKIFNLNNIEINIVGNIGIQNSKKIIASITSKLLSNTKTSNKNIYSIKNDNHHTEFDSKQSHLAFIIPSVKRDHPDYHDLLVANYIFGGGGFGSWLVQEIREKRGLSYSVYSYLGAYKNQGYMRISLQTKNNNLDLAKQIVFSQIERLKNFNVTEEEIEIVKKSILKNFEMRIDTNRKLLNLLSAVNNLNLPLDYFEDYEDKLMSVSKESIRKALDSSINFNDISILSVGKTIE